MRPDFVRVIVEDFLKNSWHSVETIVRGLARFKEDREKKVNLFYFKNGQKNHLTIDCGHFFLRGSVKYSNPQLTVEEVQGIIATRLLEV